MGGERWTETLIVTAAKMVNSTPAARLCYQARRQVVVLEEKPPKRGFARCPEPGASMGGLMNMSHGAAHDVSARPEAAIMAALGRRSVVLVGMMGAGKSSIGRRVALRLGIPFVDADAEIEKAAGMTIPDIFAMHGERDFRAGEARVIARLLESGPQVLATGGGAFMNADTRAVIGAKGVSIWLKAEFDVLMRRIKRRHDRPLLKTDDPAATLRALMDGP